MELGTVNYFYDLLKQKESLYFFDITKFIEKEELSVYGGVMNRRPAFADYYVFDKKYYKQKYYEDYIENCLFNHLIKGLFFDLLKAKGYKCFIFNENYSNSLHIIRGKLANDNEEVEDLDFIVEKDNKIYGLVFENRYKTENKFEDFRQKYGVDELVVLYKENPRIGDYNSTRTGKDVKYLSFENFFVALNEKSNYKLYDEEIKTCLLETRTYCGFMNISEFNHSFLHNFKNKICNYLKNLDIENLQYEEVKYAKNNSAIKYSKARKERSKLIAYSKCLTTPRVRQGFIDGEMFLSLVGKSEFAKSFLTAEYLYDNFKANNRFDFTAIAACYVKSIEQLLGYIVKVFYDADDSYLDKDKNEWKYVYVNNIKYSKYLDLDLEQEFSDGTIIKKSKGYFVLYANKYNSLIDDELSLDKLVSFFEFNKGIFNLSERKEHVINDAREFTKSDKDILCACLNAYKDDRNNYLHKGFLEDPGILESIRKNTIFLYAVILGSLKKIPYIDFNSYFKIVNDDYEDLCDKLYMAPYNSKLIIRYPDNTSYKVILKRNKQDITQFDNYGYYESKTFYFVKERPDMDFEEFWQYSEQCDNPDVIKISENNYPSQVELFNGVTIFQSKKK